MPFLLPLFGDALWAILAVLGAVAMALLVRALAATVGGLPLIGSALRGAIDYAGGKIQGWFTDATRYAWGRVSSLIRAWPYLLRDGFFGIVGVLVHLGDQIAHHNNVTIPQAANSARSDAYNHADSLAASLQANIDHTVAQESHDVISLQDNITSLSRYVDGPFHSAIDNAISAAKTDAETAARTQLQSVEADIVARIGSDEAIISQLSELTQVAIPAEINQAIQTAESQAHAELSANVAAITTQLAGLQSQITANATAEANALATARQAIATQQAADLSTAEGVAQADAAAALATAQMGIAATAAQANAALQSQAAAVAAQLQTIQDTETITQANVGALQQTTAVAIPLSIAAVAAGVATITSEFERCAVTSCEGPNNFSNLLNDALGLVDTAGFFAFLAEAVHSPGTAVGDVLGLAGDLTSGAETLIDSLLSL
jgi:hypothetical protein